MAAILTPFPPHYVSPRLSVPGQQAFLVSHLIRSSTVSRKHIFRVQAAKLPAGVEYPKEQPKLKPPFLGFTRTAEIYNSRACMIGLIGTFVLELILNKGILQAIGVDVGKGLDLPL
ncbi:unnamed protein product [Cuscuta epithymum]|uniref:Uncharacterized protein n=1 Tax=Cuscuta epithymum TaxID=186058 RepID=A0AAV0CGI8_9ASTE|nr:unnamed protein product [Cuscuta epithymum]